MALLLHPSTTQITAVIHYFWETSIIVYDPNHQKQEEKYSIDSCVNEREILKRINLGHDNSTDVGDPGMNGGELENNILFEYIKFEVSETHSHRTTPEARPFIAELFKKCIKRYLNR